MNRPWQIWLLFALCLAAVAPAMGYLSCKALELDRAEALARRQAELDESVHLALWRMDSLLAPLLAQEATRPPHAFQPFLSLAGAPGAEGGLTPSPLLWGPSEFVRLHFQAAPGDRWTSPQVPAGELWALAARRGIDSSALADRQALLSELRRCVDYAALMRHTPAEMLPGAAPPDLADAASLLERQLAAGPVVSNSLEYAPAPLAENSFPSANDSPDKPFSLEGESSPGEMRALRGGKGASELLQRNRAFQHYAQQQVLEQRVQSRFAAPLSAAVREGVSRVFWIEDKLLLARRVQSGDELLVQGCWLDWGAIERRLLDEVGDLLPGAALAPVIDAGAAPAGRMLATLPAQVVVAPAEAEERPWSPIRLSLAVAWTCLAAAAAAMAVLVAGVVSLSERRAAFVAAVTHELRTPLTTFRMYSEMLARGMTPPEKRQEYLETLHAEADRLTHLVENVLAYARLERGRRGGRRIAVALPELLNQWTPRLAERAAQAGLELAIDVQGCEATAVSTDPQAVGQILFNLVDNAAKYAANASDRRIELSCRACGKTAQIRIRDHGPGIPAPQRGKLFRPFSKTVQEAAATAPGVGLGLALCRRLARALGGSLTLERAQAGAAFVLELPVARRYGEL